MRILVVEDEPAIADFLRRGLEAEGYKVETAADGRQGEARSLSGEFDLLLLDIMLPLTSGLEVLRSVRGAGLETPVILLTARTEVPDRVEGLDAGATDYVVKPFSFEELAARVRAALRVQGAAPTRVEAAGIEVDLVHRRARRDGRAIPLSGRETELLALLVRNAGMVVGRKEALATVWGYRHDPGTNALGVYVGYLRRKLGEPDPIETVRGVGYRLRGDG